MAMCGPSCILAFAVSQVVERFRKARWHIAIQADVVPVTVGLVAASALVIARGRSQPRLARHYGNDVRFRRLDPALAARGVCPAQRC
jgi:chromate transport protein ChrA